MVPWLAEDEAIDHSTVQFLLTQAFFEKEEEKRKRKEVEEKEQEKLSKTLAALTLEVPMFVDFHSQSAMLSHRDGRGR